ncbi:hypothetical protein MMC09_002127 [Bachmanniomyces sp. S44760]|nr:hypothetical protein [Bachmanniomyces sp. S44760]
MADQQDIIVAPLALDEASIAHALGRKRETLEQEIATFRVLKEKELSEYEEELKKGTRLWQSSNGLSEKVEVVKKEQSDIETVAHLVKDEYRAQSSTGKVEAGDTLAAKESGTELKGPEHDLPSQLEKKDPDQSVRQDLSEVTPSEHEEFQGLFHPAYFPLLSSQRPHSSSSASNGENGPPEAPPNQFVAQQNIAPAPTTIPLSSSATLPFRFASPHQSRPLSASVPRRTSLHNRRSSSLSNSSIQSLRSSLRDPRTPRSPKHVLFSIDNTVVSPSASPVFVRKGSMIGSVEGGRQQPTFISGLRDWPDSGKEMGRGALDVKGTGTVESTVRLGVGSGEDFEYSGRYDDALFTFDEDMALDGEGEDHGDKVTFKRGVRSQ